MKKVAKVKKAKKSKTIKKVRKIQKPPKSAASLTAEQCKDAVKKVMEKRKPKDIVQVKNPKTGLYIKIDRSLGKILAHKKTKGAYKNIKITIFFTKANKSPA